MSAVSCNGAQTARVNGSCRLCHLLPHMAYCSPSSVFFDVLRPAFCPVCFRLSRDRSMMSLRSCRLMRRPLRPRKCKHCRPFLHPDPRRTKRQHSCAQPACRQASKAASQRRWLRPPDNRDDFRGPAQVERVRPWRQAHPGDGRRQRSRTPEALQDDSMRQETPPQRLGDGLISNACQDAFVMPPTMFVGLLAPRPGLTFHADIATTARQLHQVGRDMLARTPLYPGGRPEAPTPHGVGQTSASAPAVQWGRSAPGPCAS